MSFSVRSEILAAIAKTDTPETKTLLLLMLGVLEEIGGKIDSFLQDEKSLRNKVLNGHEPSHHKHHDWIEAQMKAEIERSPVCEWAKQKMIQEYEAKKDNKSLWMKFLESIVSHVGTAVAVALIAWIALK
jgi:hypothetical protein